MPNHFQVSNQNSIEDYHFHNFIERVLRNCHSLNHLDDILLEIAQILLRDLGLCHACFILFGSRSKLPLKVYEVKKGESEVAILGETSVPNGAISKAEEIRKPFLAGRDITGNLYPRLLTCENLSHLAIPIVSLDELVGLILICSTEPALPDSNESNFLAHMASYIAILLRRAEYNETARLLHFEPQVLTCGREMFAVEKSIERFANLSTPLLISGETGVGKEIVARSLHLYSQRREHPFVPINCAAISDSLVESELFGYIKGAFTGANYNREGLFEQADKGTILFDEISNMSWKMQQVLLRIVETGLVLKIGGNKTRERRVHVRIISATNRDLRELVKRREFLADLYYRLGLISIEVPSLRRRTEEIPVLAYHFLRQTTQGSNVLQFSKEALEKLQAYPWSGNIRELKFTVERGESLSGEEGIFEAEHLGLESECDNPPIYKFSLKQKIQAFEQQCLVEALDRTGWNITETARQLNLSRRMLQIKLKHYGLAKPGA